MNTIVKVLKEPRKTPAAQGTPAAHDLDPFPQLLDRLLDRRALPEPQAEALMDNILGGAFGPERLAAFVTAMRAKGLAVDELVGFARSLRRNGRSLRHTLPLVVDTCGTGGSRHKSSNVSTAAAFVVAAAGIPVAKHGNRSVTRPSGSADVLESADARLDLTATQAAGVLQREGIVFLFAPQFHPAMRHAAPVRKALGIRTVFNLLGPLANPAGATVQVLGVHEPALLQPMAQALVRLGVRDGFVVHGEPGFDEAMPTGLVRMVPIRQGQVAAGRTLDPVAVGVPACRPDDLAPVPREEAPDLLRRILGGEGGPRADAVALNAGLAFVAAGRARTIQDGVSLAREVLRAGTARAKLESFVVATRTV